VIYYYFPGATNLADYALRQGRSFRPYAQRKASFEECH
jgi:hypothetical protein